MNDFACLRGDSLFCEKMIRRITEACADFPGKEEEDFLRLADASVARLAEDGGEQESHAHDA